MKKKNISPFLPQLIQHFQKLIPWDEVFVSAYFSDSISHNRYFISIQLMHNEKKQQQRDISTKSIEKVAQVYTFFSYLFQKTFADCSHHLNDYRVPL